MARVYLGIGSPGRDGAPGAPGAPGVGGAPEGTWASGTTYGLGAVVWRIDRFYMSNVAGNIGHDPATDDGSHWGLVPGDRGVPISAFGVKVDGRPLAGISVSGTALTALSGIFSAADVGRTVLVYKADGTGVAGQAVVSAYNSPTSLTLGSSIATTSTTRGAIGTNDTAAWQSLLNAAYAIAGGLRVTYDGSGISLIAGPQVAGTVTSTNPDAGGAVYSYSGQLLLPAVPISGPMGFLEIAGTIAPTMVDVLGFGAPSNSGLTLLGNDSGFIVDVLPDPNGFEYGVGSFSFVTFNLRRVAVRQPYNSASPHGALNLLSAACATLDECSIDVDVASSEATTPPSPGPTSNAGTGLILPGMDNWGLAEARRSQVVGYAKGCVHSEHSVFDNFWVESCGAAMAPGSLPALARTPGPHGSQYLSVSVANCATYIEPIGPHQLSGFMDIEPPTDCLINDPNTYVSGDLLIGGFVAIPGQKRLFVRSVSSALSLRTPENAIAGGPGVPVVDSLKWPGAPATPPIGVADGSNHTYYNPGPAFYLDGNGAYPVAGNGGAVLFIQNGPAWPSRKVSVTFKSSPNAGKAYGGLITRSLLNSPLQVILSNNFNPGVTIYEGGGNTQVAHAAYTIAANTEYRIDFITQTSTENPALVIATVLVNNVRVLSYTFTVGDVATYLPGGYDGLSCAQNGATDDGNSRFYDLRVTPAADLDYVVAGTVTMVAGSSVVANTSITANSIVRVFRQAAGGTLGDLSVALNAGTGFTINSSSGTETSIVYYEVLQY